VELGVPEGEGVFDGIEVFEFQVQRFFETKAAGVNKMDEGGEDVTWESVVPSARPTGGDVEHGPEFLDGIEVGFGGGFFAEGRDAACRVVFEEADLDEIGAEGAEAVEAHIFGSGGLGADGEHPAEGVVLVDMGGFGEAVEGEEIVEFAVGIDEGFIVDGIAEASAEGEEAIEKGPESWAVEVEGERGLGHGGQGWFMPGGGGRSAA